MKPSGAWAKRGCPVSSVGCNAVRCSKRSAQLVDVGRSDSIKASREKRTVVIYMPKRIADEFEIECLQRPACVMSVQRSTILDPQTFSAESR